MYVVLPPISIQSPSFLLIHIAAQIVEPAANGSGHSGRTHA